MGVLILSSLYFLLPAYIANMCPVFAGKLRLPFGVPIHEKWFGSHKTYRGFYAGYLGATAFLYLQRYFQGAGMLESLRLLDYSGMNVFLWGFLFSFGALGGDLIESFVKRRIGKKPGAPWFPFDQLDLVIGALLLTAPFFALPGANVLVLLVLSPLLHFLTNLLGYALGLKEVWW